MQRSLRPPHLPGTSKITAAVGPRVWEYRPGPSVSRRGNLLNKFHRCYCEGLNRLPSQSISGFFWLPTIAAPKWLRALWSFGRTIAGRGSMGLSGLTWAASRAACSIASISSLQPAWSRGQTTIGCRMVMSLAEVKWACRV